MNDPLFNILDGQDEFRRPTDDAAAENNEVQSLIYYGLGDHRYKWRRATPGLAQVNGVRGETSTIETLALNQCDMTSTTAKIGCFWLGSENHCENRADHLQR